MATRRFGRLALGARRVFAELEGGHGLVLDVLEIEVPGVGTLIANVAAA